MFPQRPVVLDAQADEPVGGVAVAERATALPGRLRQRGGRGTRVRSLRPSSCSHLSRSNTQLLGPSLSPPSPSACYVRSARAAAEVCARSAYATERAASIQDAACCRYDLVALACKGLHVSTNFGQALYTEELARMKGSSQVCLFY